MDEYDRENSIPLASADAVNYSITEIGLVDEKQILLQPRSEKG
jgi:hypothetical protein